MSKGESITLLSHNYPTNSYADSQWTIASRNTGSFTLTFLDFNISVGASLTIGSGDDISESTKIITIGTPDIPIDVNNTMIVKESSIWIWYQAKDPALRDHSQTTIELKYEEIEELQFDASSPSVSAIKLDLECSNTGKFFSNFSYL